MTAIRSLRFAAAGLVAAVSLALLVQAASAETPAETAIKAWIASINASPGWHAAYASLDYDATGDQVVLSGLTVESPAPGIHVSFGKVALTGFAAAADGGFAASRITADKGALAMGPLTLALSDAEFNSLTVPALPALAWDAKRPVSSLLDVYEPLSHLTMTNGRIGALELTEDNAGVKSRISYGQFRIDRWAGGKIAGLTAGPLAMESPSPDSLLTMKVASVEVRDIDIDAALAVYAPNRYVGGVGDGVWHTVTGLSAYHDFAITGPGLQATMKLLSAEGLKLRQPPHSFADYLDRTIVDPNAAAEDPQTARDALNMLSAYGVDRLGISGLDIAAVGMGGLHLGGFNVSDLSMDRIGEFAIDDFKTAVPLLGSIALKHFVIGNVLLPGAQAIAQAMEASAADSTGDGPAPVGLAPKPGFVEMDGLNVTALGAPYASLDKLRMDLADYVGPVPTTVTADVGNLLVPTDLLDPAAQAVFAKLGYETLDIDSHFAAKWNEADQTFAIDRLECTVQNAGAVDLSMQLGGLSRAELENLDTLPDVLRGLPVTSAKLTLTDKSFVGKGLDLLAEKMHAQPAQFRQKFAGIMPLVLSLYVLHDPKVTKLVRDSGILATLAPVVKAFVAAPGSSITASLAPPTPLSLAAIAAAAQSEPASLISTIGLTVDSAAAPPGDGGTPQPVKTAPATPAQ